MTNEYRYIVTRDAAGFKTSEPVKAGSIRQAAETIARGTLTAIGNNANQTVHATYYYHDSHNDAIISVEADLSFR